jgi:hypothetical protein
MSQLSKIRSPAAVQAAIDELVELGRPNLLNAVYLKCFC